MTLMLISSLNQGGSEAGPWISPLRGLQTRGPFKIIYSREWDKVAGRSQGIDLIDRIFDMKKI